MDTRVTRLLRSKYLRMAADVLMILLLAVYAGYVRAEWLTFRYGEQFRGLYGQTGTLRQIAYLRVIDYDRTRAKVCYVTEGHQSMAVLDFEKHSGFWILDTWEPVWSKSGGAQGFVFPYYV